MCSLLLVFSVFPLNAYAEATSDESSPNMDEPGFSAVAGDDLFSSGLNLRNRSLLNYGKDNQSSLETNLEIEMAPDVFADPDNPDTLAGLITNYQSQGQIKRLSTSWNSRAGSLTVGSDWANFQDLIGMDKGLDGSMNQDGRNVTSQIKWISPNGFSIALEESPRTSIYSTDDESSGSLFESSPSIILSWRGGSVDNAREEYRVTAMGNKLDVNASGQKFDGSDVLNWGLNLEGGWQIGDLFSALSVTFGKGINSYLLQKFDNDILVTPNDATPDEYDQTGTSYGIRPSLYYSLNDNSTFHVALGHYSTSEADSGAGVDTLDTIHIGYSWSPWPSTQFGLQLRDQSSQGSQGESEDTQVKFQAAKQF